jgi:hypothetical protein
MGLVLLDVTFQVEKAFRIQLPREWPERLGVRTAGDDATLEEFHTMVLQLCQEQRVPVPKGSWLKLAKIAERAACFKNPLPSTTLREIAKYG